MNFLRRLSTDRNAEQESTESSVNNGIISGFNSRLDQFKKRLSSEALSITDKGVEKSVPPYPSSEAQNNCTASEKSSSNISTSINVGGSLKSTSNTSSYNNSEALKNGGAVGSQIGSKNYGLSNVASNQMNVNTPPLLTGTKHGINTIKNDSIKTDYYNKTEYSKTDYTKQNYTKSDYSKSDYTKSDYTKSDNPKSDYTQVDCNKTEKSIMTVTGNATSSYTADLYARLGINTQSWSSSTTNSVNNSNIQTSQQPTTVASTVTDGPSYNTSTTSSGRSSEGHNRQLPREDSVNKRRAPPPPVQKLSSEQPIVSQTSYSNIKNSSTAAAVVSNLSNEDGDSSSSEYGDQPYYCEKTPQEYNAFVDSGDEEDEKVMETRSFMKNFVRTLLMQSSNLSQEEKAKFGSFCQRHSGRRWFSCEIETQRAQNLALEEMAFYSLVQYFIIALFECYEAEDWHPAKILMNMCFTFYTEMSAPNQTGLLQTLNKSSGTKVYLYGFLKDQPIWKSLRFWNAAFFDAVQTERLKKPQLGQMNSRQDVQNDAIFQENITFGQLNTFTCNMRAFGLSKEVCLEFIRKQVTIANLHPDQERLLRFNLDRQQ